jgi:hypothetical protein
MRSARSCFSCSVELDGPVQPFSLSSKLMTECYCRTSRDVGGSSLACPGPAAAGIGLTTPSLEPTHRHRDATPSQRGPNFTSVLVGREDARSSSMRARCAPRIIWSGEMRHTQFADWLASRRRSMTLEIYASASSTAPSEALRRLGESLRWVPLRYFVAVRGKPKAPPRKGKGLWPAETLVGVTGFEPAASSSRTGDHSALPCN